MIVEWKILVLRNLVWIILVSVPKRLSTFCYNMNEVEKNREKTIPFALAAIAIANKNNYDENMREMEFTAPLILHVNFFSALNLNSKCLLHCEASINACVWQTIGQGVHTLSSKQYFYSNVFSTLTFVLCTYFGHSDTDHIHFWWDAHCFWLTFDTNTSKNRIGKT